MRFRRTSVPTTLTPPLQFGTDTSVGYAPNTRAHRGYFILAMTGHDDRDVVQASYPRNKP